MTSKPGAEAKRFADRNPEARGDFRITCDRGPAARCSLCRTPLRMSALVIPDERKLDCENQSTGDKSEDATAVAGEKRPRQHRDITAQPKGQILGGIHPGVPELRLTARILRS